MSAVGTRLFQLLEVLSRSHWGVGYAQLVERFEISQRQIRRDLDALVDLGFDIRSTRADEGTVRITLVGVPEWVRDLGRVASSLSRASVMGSTPSRGGLSR